MSATCSPVLQLDEWGLVRGGEGVANSLDGVAGGLGGEVAVDVGGGGQGGVAQGLGDNGEGDAGGDGDGGGEVTQVVDAGAGDTEFAAEVMEAIEDVGGVEGAAVGPVEDVAAARRPHA